MDKIEEEKNNLKDKDSEKIENSDAVNNEEKQIT